MHFEVENEKLDIGCYGVLVLLAETIKVIYQTKHLNKLGILLYKKKTQKLFYMNKHIKDYKRHIIRAYIQSFKFVHQKLRQINSTDSVKIL